MTRRVVVRLAPSHVRTQAAAILAGSVPPAVDSEELLEELLIAASLGGIDLVAQRIDYIDGKERVVEYAMSLLEASLRMDVRILPPSLDTAALFDAIAKQPDAWARQAEAERRRTTEHRQAEVAHPCRCAEPKPATEMTATPVATPHLVCSSCGYRQQKCKRTVCRSRVPTHWNWSTRCYYCTDCAEKINDANGEVVCLPPLER